METMIHIQCGVAIKNLFKNETVYDVYRDVAGRVMDNEYWWDNQIDGVESYNACDDIFAAHFRNLQSFGMKRCGGDWVEDTDIYPFEMKSNSQIPVPLWNLHMIRGKQGIDHLRLFATG